MQILKYISLLYINYIFIVSFHYIHVFIILSKVMIISIYTYHITIVIYVLPYYIFYYSYVHHILQIIYINIYCNKSQIIFPYSFLFLELYIYLII